MNSPVLLVILDGWGIGPQSNTNAVWLARTPHFDQLWRKYPSTMLSASGVDVGLPPGVMGNSEVGHLNLGAGNVVQQEVTRINEAIENGKFFQNGVFSRLLAQLRKTGGRLHLLGLTSNGLVHSAEHHYLTLLELTKRHGFTGDQVQVHAIVDGRDTPPQSAISFLQTLQDAMDRKGVGRISTVMGRYYAMDRDKRWDRVRSAYELLTEAKGDWAGTAIEAIQAAYERGETDEFVSPTVITRTTESSGNVILDGDALIVFNYRADRGRQIVQAFIETDFDGFSRGRVPEVLIATMTSYDEQFGVPCAFRPPQRMNQILGETISLAGRRQLRVAETEKYPHVTYFFNGGDEQPFKGEERKLVYSPRDVATYDKKPEMSAREITSRVTEALRGKKYDFVLVNFANPDMVGHTGSLPATISAVETVDGCLGKIIDEAGLVGGAVIVTADHGNAEMMLDSSTSLPHTAHTTNLVPLILVDEARKNMRLRARGRLADVAPTVLSMMNIPKPVSMSGVNLTENQEDE